MMLEEIVSKYINENNLFNADDKIIVGLSGGADSVALLMILRNLGYDCIAAHCNFHLRGDESNRDEKFVVQLCDHYQIKLILKHFQTTEYAQTQKISIEMAARELRYSWFDSLIKKHKADKLAIAHHRDDNIETLLLNLIRGTGLKGLTGIPRQNNYIVRPLLEVSRKDLVQYLDKNEQKYVTDSTNLEDEYARNKIRLNIIPQMKEINSACVENIQRTINYLNEVKEIYDEAISNSIAILKKDNKISCKQLLSQKAPQTILFEICYPLGFNSNQISDIFYSLFTTEQKEFYSPQYKIIKSRDELLIRTLNQKESIPKPKLSITTHTINKDFLIPRDKQTACFDADLLDTQSLNLRKWQEGDSFVPFGMKGTKKVSDYFTDNKYTLTQKEEQWILTYENDIIWLIGERTDNRYRITAKSKKAVIIKVV